MSREVKRVPLDFSWPLKTVWEGFVMPEQLRGLPCTTCAETGMSSLAKLLRDQWYGYAPFRPEQRGSTPLTSVHPRVRSFAERNVANAPAFYGAGEAAILREADRLWDLTRPISLPGGGWGERTHHPTALEVNDWSIGGLGHDSLNQYIVVDAECERLGVEKRCAVCEGEGTLYRDAAHAAAHEAWQRSTLPEGDGWQMWETTSEGSPISPVFTSPEKLARWLTSTGASAFGHDTATYAQWLKMIRGGGVALSMMKRDGALMSGVADASRSSC